MSLSVLPQEAETLWLLLLGIFGMHCNDSGQAFLNAQVQPSQSPVGTTYCSMQAIGHTRQRTAVYCMGVSQLTRLSRASRELHGMKCIDHAHDAWLQTHISGRKERPLTLCKSKCHLQMTAHPKGPFAWRASSRSTKVVCKSTSSERVPNGYRSDYRCYFYAPTSLPGCPQQRRTAAQGLTELTSRPSEHLYLSRCMHCVI